MSIVTTIETLAAICRHELRLEEVYDITRLIREVKIVQETSNDSYAKLTKKQKINAREILSGYMLAWEYVEDLDGSGIGQRFWKGEISRPNTLSWPKNKKEWCAITEFQLRLLIYVRILAGVEKMFLELQDYSEIDRQEKNSRSKPVTYREEDARYASSPQVRPFRVMSSIKQRRQDDKQPKTDTTRLPDHAAPITREGKLGERPSSQRKDSKKATSNVSCNGNLNTRREAPFTNQSTTKSAFKRKRALTPPYIPSKGPHQIWPGLGFDDVSKEGARVLRTRVIKIDDCDELFPSKTSHMASQRSKDLSVKADQKQDSAKQYSSPAPVESSEEEHIRERITKRRRKSRIQLAEFSSLSNVPKNLTKIARRWKMMSRQSLSNTGQTF